MPDFQQSTHVLKRYRPFANTMSLFDAQLDFGTLELKIDVKLHFDFGLIFFNTAGYTRERWLRKYFAQIDKYWGAAAAQKYVLAITCGNPARTYKVKPVITATRAASATDAHFAVNVKALHLGRSFVTGNSDDRTKECVLYSDAVKAMPKGPVTKLAWKMTLQGTREDLLAEETDNLLRELKLELELAPDLKSFTNQGLAEQMKTHLHSLVPCYPGVKLDVVGYRPNAKAKLNKTGLEVAQAAIQALNLSSFANAVGRQDDFRLDPYVRFDLNRTLANAMTRLSDFPIAAHEFGHKLGNQDEYKNPFDTTGRRKVETVAAQVGVAPPVWDSHTSSLMSLGDVVLPCHYLPFATVVQAMYEQWVLKSGGDPKAKDALLKTPPTLRIE